MTIHAHFTMTSQREGRQGRARIRLRMTSRLRSASHGETDAQVHNLSPTGLLLETDCKLNMGEQIAVSLPEAGDRHAKVIWQSGKLYGCQFSRPIGKGVVSAVMLRSNIPDPQTPDEIEQKLRPDEPVVHSFGTRLRSLRKSQGLSLQKFADKAGVSRTTVWKWETDTAVPRRSKMPQIMNILDAPGAEQIPTGSTEVEAVDEPAEAYSGQLKAVISRCKADIARQAKVHSDKIRVIIEF